MVNSPFISSSSTSSSSGSLMTGVTAVLAASSGNLSASVTSSDEHLKRMADLIKSIEATIKKCTKKYKDRSEIEELYSNLNVIFLDFKILIYFN